MDKTKKVFSGIGVLAAIAVITFAFAIAASGSDGGVIDQNAEGVTVAASEVTSSISYQGRLADSAGEPLSGIYDMAFRLYDVSSGGTVLDTDTHSVEVTEGLFNTNIDFDQEHFDGRELWFGIIVEGEEMTPRQEFKSVPYALSLRPGAHIKYDGLGPTFSVQNGWPGGMWLVTKSAIAGWTSDGTALRGTAGSGTGVFGISRNGTGVYGKGTPGGYFTTNRAGTSRSNRTAGVNVSTAYDHSDGVYVLTTGDDSRGVSARTFGDNSDGFIAQIKGDDSMGVYVSTTGDDSMGVYVKTYGDNSDGVSARSFKSHGVYGRTDSTDHAGVYAMGKDSGADLILGGNDDTAVGDDGRIYSDPKYPGSDIFLITNDGVRIDLDNNGDGEDADFEIRDKDNKLIFNVDESGDMTASGAKAAVVTTKDYGTRKMYALESTEVWFEDFGTAQLKDGVAVVEIDPVFAETVNLSVAYHVFFTPVDGWAPIYVANKTSTSFELRDAHDKADITLEYRIVARRLGYEDVRMEQVEFGNEEA